MDSHKKARCGQNSRLDHDQLVQCKQFNGSLFHNWCPQIHFICRHLKFKRLVPVSEGLRQVSLVKVTEVLSLLLQMTGKNYHKEMFYSQMKPLCRQWKQEFQFVSCFWQNFRIVRSWSRSFKVLLLGTMWMIQGLTELQVKVSLKSNLTPCDYMNMSVQFSWQQYKTGLLLPQSRLFFQPLNMVSPLGIPNSLSSKFGPHPTLCSFSKVN